MCSSCFDNTKYTCLMCINHFCMPYSVFEGDEICGLESTQFVGVLRVMFLRVTKKNLIETGVRKELDELRHS